MKKLLLLLLLTASFSTFALSEFERAPCSSPDEVESARVSFEVEIEEAIEREIAEFEAELAAELGDQPIIDEFPINEIYLERKALEVKRKALEVKRKALQVKRKALQDKHNAIFVKFRESKKSRDFLNTRYIYQLYIESKARIKTLDAAINYIKRDIKSLESKNSNYFKTSNYYKYHSNYLKYHSMYMCKQSPEGLSLDESGKVVENGIRVGEWTWYDKFNRVLKQGNYVNGKKEGQWTERIHSYDTIEMHYKNDKLEGKWTHWSSYPEIVIDEEFIIEKSMDELFLARIQVEIEIETIQSEDGLFFCKNLVNEAIKIEREKGIKYSKNQKMIIMSNNCPKDYTLRIFEEGNYINAKKDGTWTYWNREGQIQKEEVYKDGRKVALIY